MWNRPPDWRSELLAAREKEIFHPWGQKRGVKKIDLLIVYGNIKMMCVSAIL